MPPAGTSSYFHYTRPEVLERVPRDARRVLDVGCGAGALGASIRERQGAEVLGIEPDRAAAEEAAGRLSRVFTGSVEEHIHAIEDASIDCIVLADVLEHVGDPWEVLASTVRKLAPDGRIVASIPNVAHWSVLSDLLDGRWVYRKEGILDATHLRFFTRSSVEELFWSAGLRIERLETTRFGKDGPPAALIEALRRQGLDPDRFRERSDAYQYLVVASPPDESRARERVTAVVLNWNGREDTLECLESLEKLGDPRLSVIVVDNASEDDCESTVRRRFPDVQWIQAGSNRGYAGGNNLGIQAAVDGGADFVFVINNDAVVEGPLLEPLLRAASLCPDAGFLAPAVVDGGNGALASLGGWLHDRGYPRPVREEPARGPIHEVDFTPGSAMLVRAAVVERVGLMDEAFFLTYEETDWCFRAREAGFRCLAVPGARVRHKVSVSMGGAASPLQKYFLERNQLRFWSRRLPRERARELRRAARRRLLRDLTPPSPKHPPKSLGTRVRRAGRWLRRLRTRLADRTLRARLLGQRDYALGRFGDCPPQVRRWSRERERW